MRSEKKAYTIAYVHSYVYRKLNEYEEKGTLDLSNKIKYYSMNTFIIFYTKIVLNKRDL